MPPRSPLPHGAAGLGRNDVGAAPQYDEIRMQVAARAKELTDLQTELAAVDRRGARAQGVHA